eukprot:3800-Heterococcus_DN1.PRE.2
MVHLNIHWMVCSGSSVTDYVAALRRKTQQLGLKLAQLPQYAVGPMINVHPFITHVYIAVPDAAVRGAMDTILCTSAALDFVRDNDIYTDWKEFGLEDDVSQQQQQQQQHTVASTAAAAPIPPPVGGLATSLGANNNVSTNRLSIYSSRTLSQQSLAPSHPSQASLLASPRQSIVLPAAPTTTRHHSSSRRLKRAAYCHRSGQVFVRQAPQGFVLMENRHSPSPGTRKCAQELLTALRQEIAVVEAVHAALQDAVRQVELLAV